MSFKFNYHGELEGRHAVLSASKYSWIRYSDGKFIEAFRNDQAARKGTELHEIAKSLILNGIKLPKTTKTLNMYVNDCIGFRMSPEVVVAANPDAFGTADAISYDEKNRFLRVFDLKTGVNEAKFDQLMIYVVYFCMEYGIRPAELKRIELRIYQNDECRIFEPDLEDLMHIWERIVTFSDYIYQIRKEVISE